MGHDSLTSVPVCRRDNAPAGAVFRGHTDGLLPAAAGDAVPRPGSRVLARARGYDLALCLALNRAVRWGTVQRLFAVVSRLGDGVFWYALMAVLPLVYGGRGLRAASTMAAVAVVGLALYKLLKRRIIRPRPFAAHAAVRMGARPLDRHSFPSGHTLHAAGFTLVVLGYFPGLFWLVAPFAVLVALSRMVLGLHYPSDVLAGAVLGALLAEAGLAAAVLWVPLLP